MSEKKLLIIMLAVALFFSGCAGSSVPQQETFEFYYYPNKNVYYDVEKKKFFYSLDGAKTWNSYINITDKEPANLGEKVVINSTDSVVYRDNENHRRIYAGRLFKIDGGDTNSMANVPEVSERKIISKPKPEAPEEETETEVEAKTKKGIKKLFDKIFGKHRKK